LVGTIWKYTYEQTCILSNRCPDRHGVFRVLPTIRNNWHEHHGIGNGQTVADTVGEKSLSKEKPT
jgi:hypothetical protein